MFWDNVNMTGNCWLWQGGKTDSGYGIVSASPNPWRTAHRVAWELTNGPIPKGLFICHHCDNRLCVRPEHLFLGTAKDNLRDAIKKGRFVPDATPMHTPDVWAKMSQTKKGKNPQMNILLTKEQRIANGTKSWITRRRNESLL